MQALSRPTVTSIMSTRVVRRVEWRVLGRVQSSGYYHATTSDTLHAAGSAVASRYSSSPLSICGQCWSVQYCAMHAVHGVVVILTKVLIAYCASGPLFTATAFSSLLTLDITWSFVHSLSVVKLSCIQRSVAVNWMLLVCCQPVGLDATVATTIYSICGVISNETDLITSISWI